MVIDGGYRFDRFPAGHLARSMSTRAIRKQVELPNCAASVLSGGSHRAIVSSFRSRKRPMSVQPAALMRNPISLAE